ncbi:MAG: hypothetical protein QOG64_1855 [Acidimicrobiaceae bacterium]|nr:hypothetical protein [Acidimicrobiaceae bacterium]
MTRTLTIVALLSLAACGGSAGPSTAPLTRTGPATTAAPTTTAPAAAPTTGPLSPTTVAGAAPAGSGAVTVSATAPVQFSGTIPTTVACANERGHYFAEASAFPVGDRTASFSANISGYGGPRIYTTEVSVEFLQANGSSDKVTASVRVNVLDDRHGSFSISGTSDAGHPVAATYDWFCS